ncbi:MAG: helical backbone metal receptor [Verrucomicrobiae bacterium]|nr:helical backbone metal receptor [Verrucomicrobiae bacterium]
MRVFCELLGNSLDIQRRPERIISLASGLTETVAELGAMQRLIGVSPYCHRYVHGLVAPVVGDYLVADTEVLRALKPDLILLTGGIQMKLAKHLADADLPAYALPLPSSRFGILENIITVGALIGELLIARSLADRLNARAASLQARAPATRPRVYVELWFGRHVRMVGGRCFVHDLIELAGGDNIFAANPDGYLPLDPAAVTAAQPHYAVFFSEPEYPVSAASLLAERGWNGLFSKGILECGVQKGRNLIHDGPSYFDTATWLFSQLHNTVN